MLERLWDFFLAPAPSGAMARAGSSGGLPSINTAVSRGRSGDAGDAGEDGGACGSTVEGSAGSALGCATPLARSISQRFPAFLTPTGVCREGACVLRLKQRSSHNVHNLMACYAWCMLQVALSGCTRMYLLRPVRG